MLMEGDSILKKMPVKQHENLSYVDGLDLPYFQLKTTFLCYSHYAKNEQENYV